MGLIALPLVLGEQPRVPDCPAGVGADTREEEMQDMSKGNV